MSFSVQRGLEILERTPEVLTAMLSGLSDEWLKATEGGDSWSPYDIVGHLVHGEKTDWMERTRRILEDGPARPFDPFDRFAQFEDSQGKTIDDLLEEFRSLRRANLERLKALDIDASSLERRGTHPALGEVSLGELLATWVTHDLGHIAQVSRVMAKVHKGDVGPWAEYLPILGDREGSG